MLVAVVVQILLLAELEEMVVAVAVVMLRMEAMELLILVAVVELAVDMVVQHLEVQVDQEFILSAFLQSLTQEHIQEQLQ
jgi:hypothetical protein